jgi:hypothetical protein
MLDLWFCGGKAAPDNLAFDRDPCNAAAIMATASSTMPRTIPTILGLNLIERFTDDCR